jgi:hypothetical protein
MADENDFDPFRPFSDASIETGLKLLIEVYAMPEEERLDTLAVMVAVMTKNNKYSSTRESLQQIGAKLRERRNCKGK